MRNMLTAADAVAVKTIFALLQRLTEYASDDYYVTAHTEPGVRLWHSDGYSPGVFVLEDDEHWMFVADYREQP